MKAQELRIGNYVLDSGGKVLRIDFFEHLQSGYDCKFGQRMFIDGAEVHPLTEYTNSAKPIPLTEQWLLDFCFEKDEYQDNYEKIGFDIRIYDGEFLYCAISEYFPAYSISITYVHELQNLYFALTGEELQL